jgi:hypothetical protein
MFKRFRAWIKGHQLRPPTAEELKAERETKHIKDEAETTHIAEREAMRSAGR